MAGLRPPRHRGSIPAETSCLHRPPGASIDDYHGQQRHPFAAYGTGTCQRKQHENSSATAKGLDNLPSPSSGVEI